MFTPHGYYRPKLGWGALGGPGNLGGMGDFGAEDNTPSFTPPSGWTVIQGPVLITADNQVDYASGDLRECGVKGLAVEIPSAGGGVVYAPPVGWYGVMMQQDTGSAGDEQYMSDTVWIDPGSRKSYQINACTESSTSSESGGGITGGETWTPIQAGTSGLVIAGAVIAGGLLLWKFLKK